MSRYGEGPIHLDRRLFLKSSAALGGLALGGGLAAAPARAQESGPYPNYYPAAIPTPDVPAHPLGGEPGYFAFPKTLTQTVFEKPANGGEATGLVFWGSGALPTPMERNSGWQQLNRELGTELNLNIVLQADYAAKWGTITASGDLPDYMYISIVPALPNVAAFVKAASADLTPFLAGDAIKDYPNLADYPRASWNAGIIDGKLWGVPVVRPVTGFPMFIQTSLMESLGLGTEFPTNGDDFTALCRALTNPSEGRWAIGISNDSTVGPYSINWFLGLFRGPNNWRLNDDGSLQKDIETEEFRVALVYLRELIEAGLTSPDVKSNADLQNDLFASKIAMRPNSWNNYVSPYTSTGHEFGQTYRTVPPFGHDGQGGTNLLAPGHFGWCTIRNAPEDRVRELLRVMNYLAAPFGSQEYMVTKYGVEGEDWNYDDTGTPQFTEQGQANMSRSPTVAWERIAANSRPLYSTEVPDFPTFAAADQKLLLEAGVQDPTQGHYSETDAQKGAQLNRLIFDRVSGMAAGRNPLSGLDALVADWKRMGGDQVRAEYESSIGA